MKKFMKGCAITALILLLLGVVMTTVAVAVKGTTGIGEIVESVTHGKVNVDLDFQDGTWGIFSGDGYYDIENEMMFDKEHSVITAGSVDKTSLGNNIENLDIEAGGCEFRFRESGDDNFYLTVQGMGKIQYYVEAGTLYIKSTQKMTNVTDLFSAIQGHEMILYVPSDYYFDSIDLKMGAGLLEVKELKADEIKLEVGAGQITVGYLEADDCAIEVGMGEVLVEDMLVNDLQAETGMGHCAMEGTVKGDLTVDCAMGAIDMELNGDEDDFNYELGAAMGAVSIGREEYSGLSHDRMIDNGADKDMKVDCAMGAIKITFR